MLKETIYITRPDMVSVLMGVENPTFINLVTKTKVRMNKKGNPFHDMVTKCLSSNFYIGSNYENRVNNNRVKEGVENDFVSSPLSGKQHISKCVLTNTNQENGVKFYLMCEWFKRSYPKISYKFQNDSIDKVLFEDYLIKRTESVKQDLDKKVNIVTYGMESIKEVRMNKTLYILID